MTASAAAGQAPSPGWLPGPTGPSSGEVARAWQRPELLRRAGVRPIRVVCACVVGLMIGNLGRAPVLLRGPEWPVLFNDVLVTIAVAACALACLQARRLRLDGFAALAATFAGISVGASLWAAQKYGLSGGDLVVGGAYLARWLLYFGLYVGITNVARVDDADALWRAVERMVVLFAAFGVFQVIAFHDFAQQIYPSGPDNLGWDVQGRRFVSTMLDPNYAGIFLLLPLFVYLALLAFGERVAWWRPVFLLACLLLTVSRGSTLAFLVGLAVIVSVRGVSRRLAKGALAVVVLAAPLAPVLVRFAAGFDKFKVDDSAMARVQSWLRALQVIVDNPVFGVGYNMYGSVARAYGWGLDRQSPNGLDGGLLFVTVVTGFVGLAVYLGLLALILRQCRRLWRNVAAPRRARAFALGTAAGTVALVLHSLTVNSLLLPFVMEVHWVLLAIVTVYARTPWSAPAGAAARVA